MKSKTYKIILLLSGIITGIFIISNLGLSGKIVNFSLTSYEYTKAVEERNNLYSEIENIEKDNIDMKYKIRSYKGTDKTKTEKLIQDMKNQLKDYGNISGINEVKGSGIVIKIQDGDNMNAKLDPAIEIMRKLFHEDDMAMVLNEIRNTSAEAISIKEHRVLPNTGVTCNWALIGFDDQSQQVGPYYIYVIGDPEEMYTYLMAEDGYLKKLIIRGLKVEVEKRDEIIIPQTSQSIEPQFMQRYDGN